MIILGTNPESSFVDELNDRLELLLVEVLQSQFVLLHQFGFEEWRRRGQHDLVSPDGGGAADDDNVSEFVHDVPQTRT